MPSLEALRKKILEQTKRKVSEAYTEKDRHIIQAINTIDDLDAMFNLLVARVREWYGLHFPELNQLVKDHEDFLRIVVEAGEREKITELGWLKDDLKEKVAEALKKTVGSSVEKEDLEMIQKVAELALQTRKLREEMRKYLADQMKQVAPNITAIAGPALGARLIAKAGGLKKLAFFPASTIQVLGAEKALFRHLTKGTRPPKHGILFQHPLVRKAKWWQRGKIARTLAAKLAIAAKEDYFGKKYIADRLLKELEERVKEVQEKYPTPPKRGKRKRR